MIDAITLDAVAVVPNAATAAAAGSAPSPGQGRPAAPLWTIEDGAGADVVRRLYVDEQLTGDEIARRLGVGRGRIYRLLRGMGVTRDKPQAMALLGATGAAPGRFRAGQSPWNKGMAGIHLSPATEFRPGNRINERYDVGAVVRRCNGRNRRNYVKTEAGWVLYAVWLWEQAHGPIIDGDVVHHLNGDRFDDRIENLVAFPRADHPVYHGRWGCKPVPPEDLASYVARYEGRRQ